MGLIVVGVDGSDRSATAFRWALEEARLRHATLDAVHGWVYPYVGDIAGLAEGAIGEEELEQRARAVLDQSVEAAGALPAGVRVNRVLVHGEAASVLLEAADGAELLVVGSRGRGGFAGLLLGSVSQQCAHHARCPVVIVPTSPATA